MLRLVVNFFETPDDVEDGVRVRTARAELIGKGGRTYHVLLCQEALRKNIGGTEAIVRAELAALD